MNSLFNLARVTTATVGTGTIVLGAAVAGLLTFAQAGVPDGAVVTYAIQDGLNSEIGQGTYTAAGTILTRDTVYRSTGAANVGKITLSGSAQVFITPAAEDFSGAAAAIGALTGDVTATGPGTVAATLATVNANVGSFGSSTSIPSFTVDGKGRLTAASGNAVVAPAGTLTGSVLAAGVVTSSLTTLGTIGTGVWQGTLVGVTYGGTGANLSATGGSSQVLKQVSSGAAVTVGQLANTDITGFGTMSTQAASAVAIIGGTIDGLTGLAIRDTSAAFDVTLAATSSPILNAGRILTLDMSNVAHTLDFGATANTITFPSAASYTVAGLSVVGTWSATQTSMALSGATLSGTTTGPGSFSISATGSINVATLETIDRYLVGASGPNLSFYHSRGTFGGARATVVAEDVLGQANYQGDDGTSTITGAVIRAYAEGVISAGIIPGRIEFVTADSAGVARTRMQINSAGLITLGTASLSGLWALQDSGALSAAGELGLGATATGRLSLGGTYTTANSALINIVGTHASSVTTTQRILSFTSTLAPSGASLTNVDTALFFPTLNSTAFTLTTFLGVRSGVTLGASFSGVVTQSELFQALNPTVSGGSITTLMGFSSQGFNNGNGLTSGTVNNYGFSAAAISTGVAGGTANNRGFNIAVPSGTAPASGTVNNDGILITGNGGAAPGGTGVVNNFAFRSTSTAPMQIGGLFQFLGATASFPALKRSTTTIQVRLADDSADGNLSANQLTSTVAIGTAPLVVTSTTNVANLNASTLGGATFAAPGSIGSGTAAAGAFTTLSASSTVSGTGFSTYLASPPSIGTTAPGIIAATYVEPSVGNALTAVGTTRADALQLAKSTNNVTTAAASTAGVVLPVGVIGMQIDIFAGPAIVAASFHVYASGSETIDGVAGSTGVVLTKAKRCRYFMVAANTWISAQLGVISA